MKKQNHPFHLVDYSPWPLTSSIGLFIMLLGTAMWLNNNKIYLMMMGMLILILTVIQWWRDIIRESTFQGNHTEKVVNGIKLGMILFIISEIMFFLSFFWAFIHNSLSPNINIGNVWPPAGIITFNPMEIPLLNTMILLSSGITVTWAHHSILMKKYYQMNLSLMFTVMLGICFSILQFIEYKQSYFTIADSIYGSCFFMLTGFHGLHVIVGTIFLIVSLIRNLLNHFSSNHHLGFEIAAWYWHFVDVVWLFVYIIIYWWGS